MITSVHFKNFKAFEDFTIYIKEFNVLTGPNNFGKSTIIDGLRILHAAHRFASRYNPKLIDLPFGLPDSWGYIIPESSIPISLVNMQTNFNTDEPSLIKFKFAEGQSLTILLHPDHRIYLFLDSPRVLPRTATHFRTEFKLNLAIVPTLGPFETEEELLDEDYVKRNYGSRRSSRMFRNYWYYNSENFTAFSKIVAQTWPGITVSRPEKKDMFSKELILMCLENRMPREICWLGFGLQIWLQLLAHIVNSKEADLIVVDEPEIYLHPDLQHKILEILNDTKTPILISTHSVEIINSVEPSDVLLIDKNNRVAKRISDLEGLQNVANLLGSSQNIQLSKLARGKKILFVEGKDLKLLWRLAKICRYEDLFQSGTLTVIPIEGFTQHDRIIHTNWAFTQILGEEIKISALLDRDYRTAEEIHAVSEKLTSQVSFAHILSKKEIENYFIIPAAILKTIEQRLKEKQNPSTIIQTQEINISGILEDITGLLKTDTYSQLMSQRVKPIHKAGKDVSTVISNFLKEFEINWSTIDYRINVVCGKTFFSTLNDYLLKTYKISITYAQISANIKESEIDDDLKIFFRSLLEFKNS
jgi:AAA domain, putative AbiEii toxin, Type IV TA system